MANQLVLTIANRKNADEWRGTQDKRFLKLSLNPLTTFSNDDDMTW